MEKSFFKTKIVNGGISIDMLNLIISKKKIVLSSKEKGRRNVLRDYYSGILTWPAHVEKDNERCDRITRHKRGIDPSNSSHAAAAQDARTSLTSKAKCEAGSAPFGRRPVAPESEEQSQRSFLSPQ